MKTRKYFSEKILPLVPANLRRCAEDIFKKYGPDLSDQVAIMIELSALIGKSAQTLEMMQNHAKAVQSQPRDVRRWHPLNISFFSKFQIELGITPEFYLN